MENVEQIIADYFRGDRSAIKKRYDALFGARPGDKPDVPVLASGEDERPEGADECSSPTVRKRRTDTQEDLEAIVSALGVPPSVRKLIEEFYDWESCDKPGADRWAADVALYHLECVSEAEFTLQYALEGLTLSFDAGIASHVVHRIDPELVFPVDFEVPYNKFREILEHLGCDYEDDEELLPVEVLLSLGAAIAEFRMRHRLEHWQVWALVYDLGPRLLPAPAPYPTEPAGVWLTSVGPQYFDAIKESAEENQLWINHQARRGDMVLVYNRSPRSALVALYRCACDAYRDPFCEPKRFRTILADRVDIPHLRLKEDMRNDPLFRNWSMVKTNFNNLIAHRVPVDVWNHIKECIAQKDSAAGGLVGQYVVAAGGLHEMRVGSAMSEEEVEDTLIVPLLEKLGWKVGKTLIRQHGMFIKIGSGKPHWVVADFVGFRDAHSSDAVMVLETKRRIKTEKELRDAVEQCESYSGHLRSGRFAVAAPEGISIYDLKFPGQSYLLAEIRLADDLAAETLKKMRALLGYAELSRPQGGAQQ